jgi:hypothetical protein
MQTLRPPVVSIQTGFILVQTRHGGIPIGQPDANFKPRHQQVRTARSHPSGPGLSQLAQGDIKPERQLDHLQDTP